MTLEIILFFMANTSAKLPSNELKLQIHHLSLNV